jgi:hypothetical protein
MELDYTWQDKKVGTQKIQKVIKPQCFEEVMNNHFTISKCCTPRSWDEHGQNSTKDMNLLHVDEFQVVINKDNNGKRKKTMGFETSKT